MANANTPIGLEARQDNTAAGWDGSANLYYIPSTDTNAYRIGDAVVSGGWWGYFTVLLVTLAGTRNAAMTTGSLRGLSLVSVLLQAPPAWPFPWPLTPMPSASSVFPQRRRKTTSCGLRTIRDKCTRSKPIRSPAQLSTRTVRCSWPMILLVPTFNSASYAPGFSG